MRIENQTNSEQKLHYTWTSFRCAEFRLANFAKPLRVHRHDGLYHVRRERVHAPERHLCPSLPALYGSTVHLRHRFTTMQHRHLALHLQCRQLAAFHERQHTSMYICTCIRIICIQVYILSAHVWSAPRIARASVHLLFPGAFFTSRATNARSRARRTTTRRRRRREIRLN